MLWDIYYKYPRNSYCMGILNYHLNFKLEICPLELDCYLFLISFGFMFCTLHAHTQREREERATGSENARQPLQGRCVYEL